MPNRSIADPLNTVRVSSKYQVVIPASVRNSVSVRPGQKMQVLAWQGRIELIPVRSARQLRGFAAGIDTRVERDRDRI